MITPATKTSKTTPAVQQKTAGNSFFRKAGEETFFGNTGRPAFFGSSIQTKLSVSTPDDPHEKEADAVAEKVMRMQDPVVASPPEKMEEKLQKKEEEELQQKEDTSLSKKIQCKARLGEKIQPKLNSDSRGANADQVSQNTLSGSESDAGAINRKNISLYQSDIMRQSGRGPPTASIPFEHTLASSKGGGSVLPGDTKQFMESRFNADFGSVRIHTDTKAESMSRSVNAQAFAHGNDIYFNSGKFSPDSTEGRSLLAHELTHTIQQNGVVQRRQGPTRLEENRKKQASQIGDAGTATQNVPSPVTPSQAGAGNGGQNSGPAEPGVKQQKGTPHKPRAPSRRTSHRAPPSQHGPARQTPERIPTRANVARGALKQHAAPAKRISAAQGEKRPSGTLVNKLPVSTLKLAPAEIRGNQDRPLPKGQSPGAQIILDAIRDKAATGRQSFINNVVQKTESVQNVLASQQQQITATSTSQEARLRGTFSDTRARIIAHITGSKNQLSSHEASQRGVLAGGQSSAMDSLNTTFTSGRDTVTNSSNTYADRSVEAANNSATQFETNIQNAVRESTETGNQKAGVGDSDSDVREAKAEAAHHIASETAEKVTQGRDEGVNFLRLTGPDTAKEFRNQGTEAASQLLSGKGQADEQLMQVFTNAGTGLGAMLTQSHQSLEQMQEQILGQLSSIEHKSLTQLGQQVAKKLTEFNAAGQRILTTIKLQSEQALAAGDQQIGSVSQQIAAVPVEETQAQEGVGLATTAIAPAFTALNSKVDTSTQAISDNLLQKGGETRSAIETAASSIAAQAHQFSVQSTAQVSKAQQQSTGQLTQAATTAVSGANSVVSQVSSGVGQQVQAIDQNFQQALSGYQGTLQEQVGLGTTRVREPVGTLSGRIDQGQARAAERASRSWLSNQLHDAWEVLSDPGFWAGLLVAIVLIAAVIFLEIITAGTATIVIVAVAAAIGGTSAAVGSLVGQAMNHSFSGGWDWGRVSGWEVAKAFGIGAVAGAVVALAAVGLGISATTGLAALVGFGSVSSVIIGIVMNVINGDPWDKGLLFNLALGGLMAWFGAKVLPKAVGPRRIGGRTFPKTTPGAPAPGLRPAPVPGQPEPPAPKPAPAPGQPEPPGPRPTPVPDQPEPPGPKPTPVPDQPEPPGPRPTPVPDQPEPPGPKPGPSPAPDQPEPPGPRPGPNPDGPEPPGPKPGPEPDQPEPPTPRPPAGGRRVALNKIRFSQKGVSNTFEDGRTIAEVAQEMEQTGWDFDRSQPNMVDWGDGELQTVDHRRLVAARDAKIQEVGAQVHAPDEPLPPSMSDRFVSKNNFTDPETGIRYSKGQAAKTWGEAALFRSRNQGSKFPIRGSKEFPTIKTPEE